MQFDDPTPRLKSRLSEFNEAILSNTPIETEDARDRVRSAGVNVFVLLEDFVDRLVSYNLWLLSTDHFVGTEFRYSTVDARRSVQKTLGDSLVGGGTVYAWKTDGENSLGSLLRYLRGAADWIQGLAQQNRDAVRRPEKDFPHFARRDGPRFPFRHLALWADADPAELQRHAEAFGRIVKLVEESEPAAVRNGLDHFRDGDRFPSANKLLACVSRLRQAIELADTQRYLPKIMWLYARKTNRFGAVELEFRDYAGRVATAYGPVLVSGLSPVSFETACLLAPGNLLGTPNSSLIFERQERSEFADYWRDYPRRRSILPQAPQSAVDVEQADSEEAPPSDNPESSKAAASE